MFESANLEELANIVQSVITPEVVSGARIWNLNDQLRHKIRLAMFGPGSPNSSTADISVPEQRELVSQFTKSVAGPIIKLFPTETAAFAVLLLYEEFADAIFICPVWEPDVGGES